MYLINKETLFAFVTKASTTGTNFEHAYCKHSNMVSVNDNSEILLE